MAALAGGLLLEGVDRSVATGVLLGVVVVGWFVVLANMANLMDGINGLTALSPRRRLRRPSRPWPRVVEPASSALTAIVLVVYVA